MEALVVLRRPSRRLDPVRRRVIRHAARELPKIIEIALRRTDRVVVERNFGTGLRAVTENPKRRQSDPRRPKIAQQRELARALADLGPLPADQERVVPEVPREWF